MILDTYLKKLNVKSYLDLNEEERKTFRVWEDALNGRRITDEEIQSFFASELTDATSKVIHERAGSKDDIFLKVKIDFLIKITALLNAPKVERKMLENAIEQNIAQL